MGFDVEDLKSDPLELFESWFEEAKQSSGMSYPNAMCLSTIGEDGFPDSRIVLLRSFGEKGFVFYTNLQSTKGKSLAARPPASLNFYWDENQRQVRIQGVVSPVSNEQADEYFASRPRNSQIGAWASHQSQPLKNRKELEDRIKSYEAKFAGAIVPRPPHWSGFCLSPKRIEFWQEREFRLHDRFVFEKSQKGWEVSRLSP